MPTEHFTNLINTYTYNTTYTFTASSNTTYVTLPISWTSSSATVRYSVNGDWVDLGYVSQNGIVLSDGSRTNPAQQEQRARDIQARRQREEQQRITAHSRADELLFSMLTEEQAEMYRRDGSFVIDGSHGGRYRICRGVSGNVLWLPNEDDVDEIGGRFCAHPTMRDGWLPTPDVMLAQMLALTTDEREFIQIANVHGGRRPTHLEAVA